VKGGIVIINKGEGLSSFSVVSKVRRIFGVKKAGHTGTLDPMATGVLPVLLERGVKASEYMLTSDKHYSATLLLGITTDTEDVTGEVLTRSEIIPTEDEVMAAINSMLGTSEQVPPMYSAIKVGGKKLCDLARRGETVERESRQITIYKIDAEKINGREYKIDVVCSKGTYIRTLCADIGKHLGCGGAMAALERVETGGFNKEQSYTVAQLEEMSSEERASILRPTEILFSELPAITLPPFFEKLCRSGCEIYLKKLSLSIPIGTRTRIYTESGSFFAIGEVGEFQNGIAVKAIKTFVLE